MRHNLALSLGASSLLLTLGACNTTDIAPARELYAQGEFQNAAAMITTIHPQDKKGKSKKNRAGDNIWLLLEKGKMLMDAGQFKESNIAFYEANRILGILKDEASICLGAIRSGAAGLTIDDRQSDYVGNTYDRILMPAYVAINHLMLGEFENAAGAARQQDKWQNQAAKARENESAQIRAMDAKATKEKDKYGGYTSTTALAYWNGKFAQASDKKGHAQPPSKLVDSITAAASSEATPALAGYSIPFGRYAGAIALRASGDRAEANSMAADVAAIAPRCPPIKSALGQPKTAYVIFETGGAPKREDKSFSFVYMYKAKVKVRDKKGNVIGEKIVNVPSYVKLPFVGLAKSAGVARSLHIQAGAQTVDTEKLHDVSGTVALEFKESLPGTIARVVIRAVAHEVTQIALNDAAGIFGVLFGAIAKSQLEPDLRGWESLPAQHQVAVIPVPENGVLTFNTVGGKGEGSTKQTITVPVGPPVLVYARSTNPSNLIVHHCPLGATRSPSQ